jgi:hypothetical protein
VGVTRLNGVIKKRKRKKIKAITLQGASLAWRALTGAFLPLWIYPYTTNTEWLSGDVISKAT